MNIENECVGCIINQSLRVASAINADKELTQKLHHEVALMSEEFSFTQTPPHIAAYVYEKMADIAQKEDLYAEVKALSTAKALSLVPALKEKLSNAQNRLLVATKIAVAGNVIDLAAAVAFDLDEELAKVFDTAFAHDNFLKMQRELSSAKELLIIGDNVGEHIFDYMFIETLQELYPDLNCTYMVRGKPIINDVTMKEAREAGFEKLCNLVDSGVDTPGFAYSHANTHAQELFERADLVISKGMGNYECMSESHKKNICFLLKVKCNVVANSLNAEVGDIICKLV